MKENEVIMQLHLLTDFQMRPDMDVRIHIGNQLYDIDHIDTVIDMDTNKPNIVIHVKEKLKGG